MYIDHSVYPDWEEPPADLVTPEDKADYIQRICAAWDFYIHPEQATFELFSGWKDIFDLYPISSSAGYHAFRQWFGWEPAPVPPGMIFPEPLYRILDRIEDREDPCEGMI